MAKCVQIIGQGIPYRTSDEGARTIVEIDKDRQYCPKTVWKQFWDHNPDSKVTGIRQWISLT